MFSSFPNRAFMLTAQVCTEGQVQCLGMLALEPGICLAAGLGISFIPDECVEQRPGIVYVPLQNWHQALYMCILYDKWLEPPVWDFIALIMKRFRGKKYNLQWLEVTGFLLLNGIHKINKRLTAGICTVRRFYRKDGYLMSNGLVTGGPYSHGTAKH